jgi:hydroxyacylglutathione hydrolase
VTTLDEWFAAGHRPETTPQIEARDLAESLRHGGVTLIDVRTELEFGAAHIRGAQHVPLGHLSDQIDQIPRGRPVVVQCQGGGRSAIAASLLRERGVPTVINFAGGLPAWTRAGLPVVS